MKTVNISSVIDKFCKKDAIESQKWMEYPFSQKGYSYATDGHIAIKIADNLGFEERSKPDMDYIFCRHTSQRHIISLAEIKSELATVPLIDEVKIIPPSILCEDCEDGYVDYEFISKSGYTYTHEGECPICDGSGFLDKGRRIPTGKKTFCSDVVVSLRHCSFAPKYLELLVELCNMISLDKVVMKSLYPQEVGCLANGVKFELIDGIEVLLMQKTKER